MKLIDNKLKKKNFLKKIKLYLTSKKIILIKNNHIYLWIQAPLGTFLIQLKQIKFFKKFNLFNLLTRHKALLNCNIKKFLQNTRKHFLKGLYTSLNLKGINLKFILKKNYIHFFLGFSHFIIISRIKNIHIFSKKKICIFLQQI